MKKITLLAVAVIASTSMIASAQTTLADTQTLWAKQLTTSNATQGSQIAWAKGGGIFVIGDAGTKTASEEIKLGDDLLGYGVDYGGNSTNCNLVLNKLDAAGNLLWTVISCGGETASNETCIAPTNDGGVVAFFKMRHTQGYETSPIKFKDATGSETTLDWSITGTNRYYNAYVVKVNAQGAITWITPIEVNHVTDATTYPAISEGTNIGTGVYTYAVEIDAAGNVYIAGRMVAALTIDGTTIAVHNTSANTINNVGGNMFLIKLDSNGNYINHIVSGGTSGKERITNLAIDGNSIYLLAAITGATGGSTFSLGNIEATSTGTFESFATAKLDLDLTPQWFKFYESNLTGSAINSPNLTIGDDELFIGTYGKMGLPDVGGSPFSASLTRQAIMLKANAQDGALTAAMKKNVNQEGYVDAFMGSDGKLYAMSYGLTSGNLVGNLVLDKINPATMAIEESATLMTNTANAQGIAVKDRKIFTLARAARNVNINFINSSDITFNRDPFTTVIAGYELPQSFTPTAISSVNAEKTLKAVRYFNATGIESATPHPGFNIMVKHYSDGSREVVKIMR